MSGVSNAYASELANYRAIRGDDIMMRWLHKNHTWLVFLAMIAIGLLVNSVYPHHWWLYSTVHSLSDAIMVAGMLGLTVDRFLKHELIREVGSIIIGWALPDEIRNHIRDVTRTSFVRRNHRFHYSFSAGLNSDDVNIDVTEEWEVFNYSTRPERYKPHFAIHIIDNLEKGSIRCTITPKVGTTRVFTAEQLNEDKCLTREKTRLVYRPRISLTIPYQNLEDFRTTAACIVKWQYRITKKRNDFIATHSTTPTIGTTVSIDCSCGLQFEFDPDDVEHAPGTTEWRYPSVFMPLQVWYIRWYPELAKVDGSVVPVPPGEVQ